MSPPSLNLFDEDASYGFSLAHMMMMHQPAMGADSIHSDTREDYDHSVRSDPQSSLLLSEIQPPHVPRPLNNPADDAEAEEEEDEQTLIIAADGVLSQHADRLACEKPKRNNDRSADDRKWAHVRVGDKLLLEMGTAELNRYARDARLSDEDKREIKEARRRLKNRFYARASRKRRASPDTLDEACDTTSESGSANVPFATIPVTIKHESVTTSQHTAVPSAQCVALARYVLHLEQHIQRCGWTLNPHGRPDVEECLKAPVQ